MTRKPPKPPPVPPELETAIRRDELRAVCGAYLFGLGRELNLPALAGASEAVQRGDHHRWLAARAAESAANEEALW